MCLWDCASVVWFVAAIVVLRVCQFIRRGSALVVFSYQEKMTSLSCSCLNRLRSQQCLRTTTDWQFSPFALFLFHFLFLYFDFEDCRTLIILMLERSNRENAQIFMDHDHEWLPTLISWKVASKGRCLLINIEVFLRIFKQQIILKSFQYKTLLGIFSKRNPNYFWKCFLFLTRETISC